MSYLFFLFAALHVFCGVVLSFAMAAPADGVLSCVPAHLTWWSGLRWGHPQAPRHG